MESSSNSPYVVSEDESLDLKQELGKYFRYWPWFLLALAITLITAYSYLRYSPRVYQTTAKMKILDESEGLELPTSAFVFKRTNINLENEIEILTSYIILERVARELKLNTQFFKEGTIQTTQLSELPFYYEQIINSDSINSWFNYTIDVKTDKFSVTNTQTEKTFDIPNHNSLESDSNLPFKIKLDDSRIKENLIGKKYLVNYQPLENATLALKANIKIEAIGEQSDLLKITIKGESKERSELILNELMGVFNDDGISDRQLVSKRTLEFIEERFVYLAQELDSIEIDAKEFKQNNNIVNLAVDAQIGLEQRAKSDDEVFRVENQIALANSLQDELKAIVGEGDLLPANIGLENVNINALIDDYNSSVSNRDRLISSGGKNNPAVKFIESKIIDLKRNLESSISSYEQQLKISQSQLRKRNNRFIGKVSQIPRQEKLFRAIDRQQKIKESLYLLLLQKREEAAINLAITEPSIKILEYDLSSSNPISPKPRIIYAGAVLGGLLIPFGILYFIFLFDTKLHSKEDITKLTSNIPVIAEIPEVKKKEDTIFDDPNARTALAESFRILSSNVDYILPAKSVGKVIYCTSTIKGEGKTYISLNLSLALSSINKKVLLIGADLRNPQIHTHIHQDKHKPGLSNYLHDISYNWKDAIISGFDKHPNHHIILSGSIPPNPAHLLTNGRFEKLLKEAENDYDYIVVDTAPTILVTDTMLISKFADATIYLARANYTEKNLLKFSKELAESKKLKNVAYVINSVGASKSYGYNYNYGYNYGYGSKNK